MLRYKSAVRPLVRLFVCLFVCLFLCVYVCLCVCACASVSPAVFLSWFTPLENLCSDCDPVAPRFTQFG